MMMPSLTMAASTMLSLLLFYTYAATATAEVFVSDPGDGIAILYEEQIPNVLGSPWEEDRPISIHSDVPVSVLRYSDYPEWFLEGGQALYAHEMVLVVKSDCGDDATLIPQVDYGNYTRGMEWDNSEYTGQINISFPMTEEEDTANIDTETVLEPSVFTSLWDYGSFWCQAQGVETTVPSEVPMRTPLEKDDTISAASPGVAAETASRPTFSPSANPNRTTAANVQDEGNSAAYSTKALVSLVVTVLSGGVFMLIN
ncbi:MAG: hypothetical protein SGILL_010818, partial [Bacillariaceae sp.]